MSRARGASSASGSTRRGGPAPRPQARRRRQELIDVAARIFHEKGYDATSIQDVAEALGILKGSIYYYINSKEDLLFEVVQEVHETALANMERLRKLDVEPLVKLRMFVEEHVKHIIDNLVKAAVFFHDYGSLNPERRQYIVRERDQYDRFLRKLIRDGQAKKVICPDVDPKLASFGVLGMMNWTYQWYHAGEQLSSNDVATGLADMVLASLECNPKTHRAGHRSAVGVSAEALAATASTGNASQSRQRSTDRKSTRTKAKTRT